MVPSTTLLTAFASVVSASTPPGFQPAVHTQLVVDFDDTLIHGQVVPMTLVASQPTIGLRQPLRGHSFAVIMVDLDIPVNKAGATTTLLHWMQTGLSLNSRPSRVGSAADAADAVETAFLLRNSSDLAPAAAYISPSPPARLPLSHTYAQLLVDTTGLAPQSSAMQVLAHAAQTRQGFNVQQVLQQAGLTTRLAAANFFNVTNPGPAQDAGQQQQGGGSGGAADNSSAMSSAPSSSSSSSSASSTTFYGSSSSAMAANGNVTSAASLSPASSSMFALAGVLALSWAL